MHHKKRLITLGYQIPVVKSSNVGHTLDLNSPEKKINLQKIQYVSLQIFYNRDAELRFYGGPKNLFTMFMCFMYMKVKVEHYFLFMFSPPKVR